MLDHEHPDRMETVMRKYLLSVVAAASIVGAVIVHPSRAEARCYGCWIGAGVAVGLLAGAAFGYPAYGYGYPAYGYGYPAYGYGYYRPAYYGPPSYAYGPRYYYRSRYYGYYGPRYYYARPYYRYY
jgi:hypothetical protein